jgi:hypothetical protein
MQNALLKLVYALNWRMPNYALLNLWIACCHVSQESYEFSKIINVNDHMMHISALVFLLHKIMRFDLSHPEFC